MLTLLKIIWYKFCQFIIRLLFIVWGVRVSGRNHIPKKGGAIIASNHQSYLDPVLLGGGLARPIHYLARQELFEANWFFDILISSVNAIPLERRRFNSEGIRQTVKHLSRGELLVVFPEGTRSRNGKIQPFKPGAILIASRASVPIIPARIKGSFEVWPRTSLLPKRWYPIHVIYGKPILPDRNVSAYQTCQEIYNRVNML